MNCRVCGDEVQPGALFCQRCNTDLRINPPVNPNMNNQMYNRNQMPGRMSNQRMMNQRMPGPMNQGMSNSNNNQQMPGRMNQQMPGRMNQQMPGRMNQQMPGRMNQQMPGRTNQQMQNRMPNQQMMNQRMPNYNQMKNWNQNNYNNRNQLYEEKDSGNGNSIITNIIIIVGILACLGALGFIGYKIIKSPGKEQGDQKTEQKETPPEEKKIMEKLSLNSISFEYDYEEWSSAIIQVEDVEAENTLAIQNENYYIVFTYEVIPQYLSTQTIALAMKENYESQGATILNNPGTDKITINNLEWYPVEYTLNNRTYYQIIFAKDYDTYAISFFTETENYNEGRKLFDEMAKTIKYESDPNENDIKAQEQLSGEWEWGKSGYFVFDDTNIYLYENSTKDSNNVVVGFYTVTNGVTKNGETKEGMTVHAHFDKFTLDGVDQTINSPDREYLFIKNSDGTYTIVDELADNQEAGKKVK